MKKNQIIKVGDLNVVVLDPLFAEGGALVEIEGKKQVVDAECLRQGMLQDLEPTTWSTDDELNFIRQLYARKKLLSLVAYRRLLPYRGYHGAGMYVNVEMVRWSLDSHIEALEGDLLR
ncbi:MAG TPA: hypothetical protein VGR71_02815 [Nitrospira sp.]|nr:hypothetical protein [Nitrospira sp.]